MFPGSTFKNLNMLTMILLWPHNRYGNGRWQSNKEVIEADREEAKKEIEAVKKEEPWKGEDQEETYLICMH